MQELVGIGAAAGLASSLIAFIPLIGGIISGLLGIFTGGTDLKPIVNAINQLASQTALALDELKRFAWSIGRVALNVLMFVARIVGDMIAYILKALRSIVSALKKLYADVIKPIWRMLRDIRKILNDLYTKWIRPIINFLQKIRKLLQILRIFGFKWAGALDARLARIESKIIGPYIWVIRQLNGYGQWINVILTATGVIQKPLFMNSVYANLGAITNLWWAGQAGQLGGATTLTPAQPVQPRTLPQVEADMQLFVATGAGTSGTDAQRALDAFNAELVTA